MVDIHGISRLLTGKELFSKFNIYRERKGARMTVKNKYEAAFKNTKAPSHFGKMLWDDFSEILKKYPNETFHYRDDFIVATKKTPEGIARHQEICHKLLNLMEKHSYSLQTSQCKFKQPKMDILGWLVEDGNITIDPAKVAETATWSRKLKDIKGVQSILKALEHLKPFIREFACIAKPLHELAKGKTPFKWTQECTDALNELVNIITSKPTLARPNLSKPFELEADASPYAVGVTLFQRDENQQRKDVGYFSRVPSLGRRSPTQDKELLAIVTGLHIWRDLLAESPHKVIVWTKHTKSQNDHHSQKRNRGVVRYVAALRDHNLELKHLSETRSHRDNLSGQGNHDQQGEDKDSATIFPDKSSTKDTIDVTSNGQTHSQQKERAKETKEEESAALITTKRKHAWNYPGKCEQRQETCQQNRSNTRSKESSLQAIASRTNPQNESPQDSCGFAPSDYSAPSGITVMSLPLFKGQG